MYNRGQGIAIDLFLGVAVFLLLLTAVLAIWSNTETTASKGLTENEMQQMAERALDRLIRTGGDPANWEEIGQAGVNAIGLAKADRVLDETKLRQFISGSVNDGLVALWRLNGNAEDSSVAHESLWVDVRLWHSQKPLRSPSCGSHVSSGRSPSGSLVA